MSSDKIPSLSKRLSRFSELSAPAGAAAGGEPHTDGHDGAVDGAGDGGTELIDMVF